MSIYEDSENDLKEDILSFDRESHSDSDIFPDEEGINIEGYSSNDEIDADVPGIC
jgi:hypothetical protein